MVKKTLKKRKAVSIKNRKVAKTDKRGKHPNSVANLKHTGRTKGSKNHDGLQVVLNMLKDFIEEKKNLEKLKKDFQKKFNQNPTGFYYKMVMPLFPKNIDVGTSDSMAAYVQIMQQIFSKAERGAKKKKR